MNRAKPTVASWRNEQIRALWIDLQAMMSLVHCNKCNPTSRTFNDRIAIVRYTKSEVLALREMADVVRERHEDDEILKRAAILHADVVMLARRDGDPHIEQPPPSPGSRGINPAAPYPQRVIMKTIDGRQDHLIDAAVHWEIGYALLARIPNAGRPAPQDDPTVRLWYQATISYLQNTATHDSEHFYRAQRLFPTDVEILFQTACLHESVASARVQAVLRSATIPPGLVVPFRAERAELELAERFFRRTLELNPSHQEARLRLGRVLGQLDRHEEAAAALRQVTDDFDHVALRYYTALFLGREEELLGRRDAAGAAYQRAAAMFPLAQSPHVALSHLAREAGDRDAALASVRRLLELPVDEMDRRDPYWVYHFIQGRHLDQLLEQLYRPFRHTPKS